MIVSRLQRLLLPFGALILLAVPIGLGMAYRHELGARLGYSTKHHSNRYDKPMSSQSSVRHMAAPYVRPVRHTFVIDQFGYPVTEDEFFNKCFQASYGKNELTIADFRQNMAEDTKKYANSLTRKSKNQPADCASFHMSAVNSWTIPGTTETFSYDPLKKKYTLPETYFLKRITVVEGSGSALREPL